MQNKRYSRVICDIHFETNMLVEVVVGILTQEGYKIERLPILNLPREILDNDKNLKNQPLYKATKDDVEIALGDRVLGAIINETDNIDSKKIAKFTDYIQEDFHIKRLGFKIISNVADLNNKISISVGNKKQEFDSCIYQISKECENFKYRIGLDSQKSILDITIFKEGELSKEIIKSYIEEFIAKSKEICDGY